MAGGEGLRQAMPRTSVYAVYDGHGGTMAADYLVPHLHYNLTRSLHFPTDMRKGRSAIVVAYEDVVPWRATAPHHGCLSLSLSMCAGLMGGVRTQPLKKRLARPTRASSSACKVACVAKSSHV
jgi:hypothetical protein